MASLVASASNSMDQSDKAVKAKEEFRDYNDSFRQDVVTQHYCAMRSKQTLEFVKKMESKWHTFDKAELTIWEAFELLTDYVDSSDPDTELPNLEHMLQTAEAIRKAGHPDWFQLTGLLHDMGKIMFVWGDAEDGQMGTAEGPQYALGGDTWVVGCRIPDEVVMPHFNALNADMKDKVMNTSNGIYSEGCGISNLTYAYGHDEYMYQMLVHNKTLLPKEALAMIRYHSCYPMHDRGCYRQFFAEGDEELIEWVKEFNQYDLYTKSDERPDVEALKPYYQGLINRYCPGKLKW